jgi:hypothetical protein
MLFSLGHGQHVLIDQASVAEASVSGTAPTTAQGDVIPLDAVLDASVAGAVTAAATPGGPFAFYFPGAATLPVDPGLPGKLDAIAAAMVEAPGDPAAQNSNIPAMFTYIGQFIDHDITAASDSDGSLSQIEGPITPLPQANVEAGLFNLRDGSLRLDSLYGDTAGQGPFAKKLQRLMRHPVFKDKMRLAFPAPTAGPPLPGDNAADLLRLGFLVQRSDVTQAELDALPPDLKANFLNPDGTPNAERAIIGDSRNDENLLVAQLHMTFLRFHNMLADAVKSFDKAKRLVRFHYQWLVVNEYLPTVCDPAVVSDVVARAAPLYAAFAAAHGSAVQAKLPLPLEFSVAAYRFGHSMIRGAYDHNRFFGEGAGILPDAPFDLLFAFTGNGKMNGAGGKLPHNWVIEWERFSAIDPTRPHRSARRIDTQLAPPLANMVNEAAGVFKHLARRNLRRGYLLSIPTAQACIQALAASHYPTLSPLTPAELTSGTTGAALDAAGLASQTPLWFYVLKEAEVRGQGQHLGPLGSILVADTLIGLIAQDPKSYWHAGSGGARWSPADSGLAQPVESFADLLRFAGML